MKELNSTVLILSEEFTDTPGPRHKDEGEFSGEEFRDSILAPRFEEALKSNRLLVIDLDGVQGYATSFLEEAFGGLARRFGHKNVEKHLQIKSDDEPYLTEEIQNYIRDAEKP